METTDLVLRMDHPPHWSSQSRAISYVRQLTKVFAFLAALFLLSHIPFARSGIHSLDSTVQEGQEVIQQWPVFKELWALLGPSFDKKEQTIREIIEVLDRYPTGLAVVTKEELAEVIYEEATRYDYDPKFIMALIAIESSFQNWSVSDKGAKGLMQIMPFVAESIAGELGIEWHGDRTLFNPFLNIKMGVHYLTRLIFDFKDLGLALEAYNNGPTKVKAQVDKKEKVPLSFYRKILDTYETL